MMTVVVFTTQGSAEHRQRIADRLLRELTTEDDAPDSVMDAARALTHVVVHDPSAWATGGTDDEARYLVRLTVPGSWNNNQFGDYVIPRITRAIAEFEKDQDRLYREPHCVVQVVGLREHSVGTLGRVTTTTEITKLMTETFRTSGEQREAPEGSVIDPVCGMAVDLGTAKITLTHDGTTHAFCAAVCRKVFAEENGIAA
jgi:YHS domain-containing protein